MYFAICYVSNINNKSDCDLGALFEQSTNANQKNNISGILMYNAGNFLQYIEGSKEAIIALYYDKISKDNRHKSPLVLFEKEITHLYFNGYESGFSSVLGKEKADKLNTYLTLLNHLESKEIKSITHTITAFLGK